MDIIKHFNQHKRDIYLNSIITKGEHKGLTNKTKCQTLLKKTIKHLLLEIKETNNNVPNNHYRWIGYDGIGTGTTGIKSGISTTQAIIEKKHTDDHLLGSVEIGKRLHKDLQTTFKQNGNNIEDILKRPDFLYCEETTKVIEIMINQWLYDNLWLWLSIRVSKKEHNKQNIARNEHTIEEKLKLKHYINVSELKQICDHLQ